jgi:hypothetical protein
VLLVWTYFGHVSHQFLLICGASYYTLRQILSRIDGNRVEMVILHAIREEGMSHISEADRETLDALIGRALLHENLRNDLLAQERRSDVLARLPLAPHTVHSVMSLSDMPEIEEFAAEVYDVVFAP